MVLGSRFATIEGKNSTRKLNILGSNIINLVILMLTGRRISDSQTGFRALKREVLEEIDITSEGYQMESELTVKALRNGKIVKEVPIKVRKRANGHSHVNPLIDGLRILAIIFRSSVTG